MQKNISKISRPKEDATETYERNISNHERMSLKKHLIEPSSFYKVVLVPKMWTQSSQIR